MTRIKRNKASTDATPTPPPPPVPTPAAKVPAPPTVPPPPNPSDTSVASKVPAAPPEEKHETTDWKKLALGDDLEDIGSPISPYQLEEPAAGIAETSIAVATNRDSDSQKSLPDAEESPAVALETETSANPENTAGEGLAPYAAAHEPSSYNAAVAGEGVEKRQGFAVLAEAPHESEDKADPTGDQMADGDGRPESEPKVPTPAEIDRAERAEKAQQRAAERAARRAAKAQDKAAAKAKRAALRAEFEDLPEARRVKLSISRISPLSAAKIGFLVAVAFALVQLVAASVLWVVLDMLHVFSSMQGFLQALSATALVNLMDALQFSRFIALVALNGVFQILVFTVLSWLAAVIYNLIARLVGGLHLVLTDD